MGFGFLCCVSGIRSGKRRLMDRKMISGVGLVSVLSLMIVFPMMGDYEPLYQGTTYFVDEFVGTGDLEDHDPIIGTAWQENAGGDWELTGDGAVYDTLMDSGYHVALVADSYNMEGKLLRVDYCFTGDNDATLGVILGWSLDPNMWVLYITNSGFRLGRRYEGSFNWRAQNLSMNHESPYCYWVTIEQNDYDFTVYRNGVFVLTADRDLYLSWNYQGFYSHCTDNPCSAPVTVTYFALADSSETFGSPTPCPTQRFDVYPPQWFAQSTPIFFAPPVGSDDVWVQSDEDCVIYYENGYSNGCIGGEPCKLEYVYTGEYRCLGSESNCLMTDGYFQSAECAVVEQYDEDLETIGEEIETELETDWFEIDVTSGSCYIVEIPEIEDVFDGWDMRVCFDYYSLETLQIGGFDLTGFISLIMGIMGFVVFSWLIRR